MARSNGTGWLRLAVWAATGLILCPVSGSATSAPESRWDFGCRSFVQARYTWDLTEEGTRGNGALRRFKLMLNAVYRRKLTADLQLIYKTNNGSSTDDRIYVQEAHLDYALSPGFSLRAGQFKPPFGWERFQASFLMPCVERTEVIDRLIPVGSVGTTFSRDYGIQFSGWLNSLSSGYELAVMTGGGANSPLSTDNGPLLVGRWTGCWESAVPGLSDPARFQIQVAGSCRRDGDMDFSRQLPGSDASFQHFGGWDRRWNAAASITSGNTRLAAEVIYARFDPSDRERSVLAAYGYFLQVDYHLWSGLEGVCRFERFDPDSRLIDGNDLRRWTFGLNINFHRGGGRLMVQYIHNDELTGEIHNDKIVLQWQVFLCSSFRR